MVLLSHLTLVSYASNWTRYTGPALGTLCFRVDRAALQHGTTMLPNRLTDIGYASNWTRSTSPVLGTLCFRLDRAALQQLSNGYRLSFTLDELHPLWQLRLPLLTGIQTGVGQARERSREGEGGRG